MFEVLVELGRLRVKAWIMLIAETYGELGLLRWLYGTIFGEAADDFHCFVELCLGHGRWFEIRLIKADDRFAYVILQEKTVPKFIAEITNSFTQWMMTWLLFSAVSERCHRSPVRTSLHPSVHRFRLHRRARFRERGGLEMCESTATQPESVRNPSK